MPDIKIIEKSVTQNDYSESPQGGAFYLSIGMWPQARGLPPSLEGLGFKDRNAITASTLDFEALWAGSVSIALAKISSLSWEVEGDIPLRTRRAHDLLLNADAGRGWVSFLAKLLQDYLLTDNGAFMEIVREKVGNANSPIIGLIPLDTLRCTRTGDPETPVIYLDMKGQYHELQSFEVVEFADMPSSRANLFGSGKCAASRAYRTIYKQSGIEAYISDKVTGRRPLAVNFISGLNDIQLRSVLRTAQSEADARGAIAYMGAIMATVPGDAAPGIATVPLADFPDNFNRKEEVDITLLTYADNLGLDPQDLQPLTGQSLGSGAQSQVLADKGKGKGLASFRQQFTHALDLFVLPDGCTFGFKEKDWRDKNLQADYDSKVEAYTSNSVKNGVLTPNQGLQKLVDEDIYPKEFLPVDITPDDTLSDDEKQEEPEVPTDLAAPAVPPLPVPPVAKPGPIPVPTAKELVQMARKLSRNGNTEEYQPKEKAVSGNSSFHFTFDPNAFNINIPAQAAPQVTVNVPEQKAPIVNLAAPVVNVPLQPAPIVNVASSQQPAPIVNVNIPEQKAQDIIVNVPKQETPVVNVDVAAPNVSVAAPEVNITNQLPPDPGPRKLDVIRNSSGTITGVVDNAG